MNLLYVSNKSMTARDGTFLWGHVCKLCIINCFHTRGGSFKLMETHLNSRFILNFSKCFIQLLLIYKATVLLLDMLLQIFPDFSSSVEHFKRFPLFSFYTPFLCCLLLISIYIKLFQDYFSIVGYSCSFCIGALDIV